jgi:hypothetical protein
MENKFKRESIKSIVVVEEISMKIKRLPGLIYGIVDAEWQKKGKVVSMGTECPNSLKEKILPWRDCSILINSK